MSKLNNEIYNVSWNKLLAWIIPGYYFLPKTFKWIRGLVSPFDIMLSDMQSFRKQTIFKIEVNGQVCRLRGGLNDRFDLTQRRITILKGTGSNLVMVYLDSENKPVHLPVYLGTGSVDFIVQVPAELQIYDADIKSFVDYYKRPVAKYKINYV